MVDAHPTTDEASARTIRFCPACRAIYRSDFERCPLDGAELATSARDPLVGHTLADHYVVEALIGEGAMGRVYRAHHRDLSHKKFAIKVLHGDFVAMASMRQRFSREAELASRLSHRNVVAVTDIGRGAGGLLFLVMDYVPGPTLTDVIARDGALAPARVLGLARQIASGLAHAHDLGLIHRDLKPDNLLLEFDRPSNREEVRIVDFGIAIANEPSQSSRLTAVGTVNGTPAYAAPEQTTDGAVDHRADLFALGVTLYEALTGRLPFDGTPVELAYQNASKDPPPMASRNPAVSVPPAVEAMVRRLMARRPDDRYASSREALSAIDALHHEIGLVPRVTTPPPMGTATVAAERRWPVWPAGLAVLALGAVGWWRYGRAAGPPPSPAALTASFDPASASAGSAAAIDPRVAPPSVAPNPPPSVAPTVVEAPATAPTRIAATTTTTPVRRVAEVTSRPGTTATTPATATTTTTTTTTPATTATKPGPAALLTAPTAGAAAALTPPPAAPTMTATPTKTTSPTTTATAPMLTAPAQPTVLATSLGGWTIAGALPAPQIKAAVARITPSLRACGPRDGVNAAYQVAFVIDEQRRARSISVSGPAPTVAACLKGALGAVRTAAAPDVGEATARVTIQFRQVPAGGAP